MVKKVTMPAKALADYILMPRTLTAENGAKALLSGEFTILHTATCTACSFDDPQEDCEVCAGEVEYTEIISVDWSTIKDIYATAVDGLAVPTQPQSQAAADVLAERRRQIEAEGWTAEHDSEHGNGQMARAAACYAMSGSCAPSDETAGILVDLAWPWAPQWWKPTTARCDLVKAGALILAEIERLDRASLRIDQEAGQ